MKRVLCPSGCLLVMMSALLAMSPPFVWSQVDASTHELDHMEDEQVAVLETVHVHGLKLNKDQQLGPVPKYTPWPTMPPSLQGQEVDEWMKARIPRQQDGGDHARGARPREESPHQPGRRARAQTMDVRSPNERGRVRRWRTDGQTSLQNGREIATVPGLSVNLSPFEGKSESQMELTGEPVRARARCVDDIP